jgi:hypothetical protein
MTVKELIAKLEQIENKDMDIVIKGTDPTDFTYYNDIDEVNPSFLFQDEYDTFEVIDEEDINLMGNRVSEVLIIDAGQF